MKSYEFEGKNTEEAIETASRELNLPVEELDINIIEPGSAGIFGLVGGKKARIKVTAKGPDESVKGEEGIAISQDGVALSRETLENILSLIPVNTTVNADRTDGKIILNIEGDKSGLLIGRKGKTLDALQHIVNKIVNKALEKQMNIVVDSENYRERREDTLAQMAFKMGEKAKRIGKPVTTNLLNPHDRRIVHLALKNDDSLDTRSRGEGLLKKVIIIPKG
ncbi:MAG: RNA-binding cell elongation regulator Jag/EloR [Pseudomonadota bacterium]